VAPFAQKVPTAEAFYLLRPSNKYIHPHAEIFRSWLIKEAKKKTLVLKKTYLTKS
jgi:LysR family glycine cleavage system transcriptional activator